MKNFFSTTFLVAALAVVFLSGCTTSLRSMREPNAHMQWHKDDFTYSEQLSGSATTTRILGIDWKRLFKVEAGNVEGGGTLALPIDISSIPVIGTLLMDRTANYALYDLMQKNPGYDVVFYPQYETTIKRPIGLGFIISKTDVKVTARLAKIN